MLSVQVYKTAFIPFKWVRAMIKKAVCEVCNDVEHKYRCPQCRIVYCSLNCYKTHKDSCSVKDLQEGNDAANCDKSVTLLDVKPENVPEYNLTEEESEDRVNVEQLKQLEDSKDLQDMLCNPHLRHMMTSLVVADDPSSQLEKAMQEPIFTEFADKCLSVIDNKENDM